MRSLRNVTAIKWAPWRRGRRRSEIVQVKMVGQNRNGGGRLSMGVEKI
jgi:hypothetical protein